MEPTEENLRAWDDAHRARPEPVELPPFVQHTLGDLTKKRVLHLLCGTGEATAALAALGAVATGLDPRPAALEPARERWPKILWVDGDPQSLPRQLRRGRFELVYSGEGVLGGLDDLDGWGSASRPRCAPTASSSSSTIIPSRIASTGCSTGGATTSAIRRIPTGCGGSARS